MKMRRPAAILAILGLAFAGCAHRQRTYFELTDTTAPERDAAEAIARGDTRVVGYMGVGLVVPGVDSPGERRVKVISGTSDVMPRDRALVVDEYARRYNRCLLGGIDKARD